MIARILRQSLAICGKDLLLEWRGRTRVLSVLLFGAVTLLLFSFAIGPDTAALRKSAPGFLTLALMLSSTLALSESFRLESEERALEGLLLLPVEPVALFYGKALGNLLLLLLLAPVLVPIALVLYASSLDPAGLAQLALLWFLASAGLAAPGTLYSAMTSRLQGQDVLMPLLLFPLVVPVLMGTTKCLGLLFTGDLMDQLGSWMMLLTVFDLLFWSICGLLFPLLMDDGA